MNHKKRSVLPLALLAASCCVARGQAKPAPAAPDATAEQVRQLSVQVQAAEQHLQDSERELAALKARLAALESTLASGTPPAASSPAAPPATEASSSESSETTAMQDTQIATLDKIKVESSSKFPVQVTGLVLLTAGTSTGGTDSSVDSTAALGGHGTTSLSLRQTILGLDAHGPHLAGASSSADIRVDFYGTAAAGAYPSAGGLLRLRTAHAALDWSHYRLFFSFDHLLFNPNTPASLVQVAEPGLAWSGNLWNWMPQLGLSSRFGQRHALVVEGAWISPPDAPYPSPAYVSSRSDPATLAESSRIPGGEARIAYESGDPSHGLRIGAGGYLSPHKLPGVGTFNSWAATLDLRVPLERHVDLTGSFYRGAGLGGLGAGGYKDFVSASNGTTTDLRALDDVGGWAQLAVHLRPTLDWNSAFGVDNAFSSQLRSYTLNASGYGSIARNRTVSSNLIWSPRPYLPFSFEYRSVYTAPVIGPLWTTNIFAFGAGYRF